MTGVNWFEPGGLLAGTSLLILDFDGPVCSVFAGYPAPQVATELLATVRAANPDLALALAAETDPLQVLRAVGRSSNRVLLDRVEAQLCGAEEQAVASATATAGAAALIRDARERSLRVAVASNNAATAVSVYLASAGLHEAVAHVAGRPFARPDLMKPAPFLLEQTLGAFGVAPADARFIGDARTDVAAGLASGVPVIGFANRPGKAALLRAAGAAAVVSEF